LYTWGPKGAKGTSTSRTAEAMGGSPRVQAMTSQSLHSSDCWPGGPKMQYAFIPSELGVLEANSERPWPFENEHCSGCFLPMHRPSHDKALDKSADWRYGHVFKGRKRIWEMRLQMNFKHDVTEPLRFGIELEDYVPLNAATRRLMGITVAAIRSMAGDDLYHSIGDNPKQTEGELEKPVFSLPLWAFDQFIVTPEGEEPPDLTDPHFLQFGFRRTDDRPAFMKEMNEMRLKAGPTYTFAFWGISQFLDGIQWRIQKVVPFKPIDFNLFCGTPPVHIMLYTLDQNTTEKRHLQSRKRYYFRLAFWSSPKPPTVEKLRKLLPASVDATYGRALSKTMPSRGWGGDFARMFACCTPNGR